MLFQILMVVGILNKVMANVRQVILIKSRMLLIEQGKLAKIKILNWLFIIKMVKLAERIVTATILILQKGK